MAGRGPGGRGTGGVGGGCGGRGIVQEAVGRGRGRGGLQEAGGGREVYSRQGGSRGGSASSGEAGNSNRSRLGKVGGQRQTIEEGLHDKIVKITELKQRNKAKISLLVFYCFI